MLLAHSSAPGALPSYLWGATSFSTKICKALWTKCCWASNMYSGGPFGWTNMTLLEKLEIWKDLELVEELEREWLVCWCDYWQLVYLLRPCKLLVETPETLELVRVGWDLALVYMLCPCCCWVLEKWSRSEILRDIGDVDKLKIDNNNNEDNVKVQRLNWMRG